MITSENDGLFLDAPEFEPFWTEAERLGMFVFVHPALKLNFSQQFDGYDTARSVGREFSLIMATIRLINSGVFDRHPNLTVHMAHLSGGIASMLGRIRSYQDKDFWGTKGNARHGMNAEEGLRPLHQQQHGVRHRRLCRRDRVGEDRRWSKSRPRASCSPPTIRRRSARARWCAISCATSARSARTGEPILSGNVGKLLKEPQPA